MKPCGKLIDLTGRVFGRLQVIERDIQKKSRPHWICKCDCGNIKSICGANLCRSPDGYAAPTRSCGCLMNDYIQSITLQPGESNLHGLYNNYKRGAAKRNKQFSLTLNEFREITSLNCYYCGSQPMQIRHKARSNGEYKYNGIDRVDNKIGYIINNCVPCCSACNYFKGSMPYCEFIERINKIHKNLNCASQSLALAD